MLLRKILYKNIFVVDALLPGQPCEVRPLLRLLLVLFSKSRLRIL